MREYPPLTSISPMPTRACAHTRPGAARGAPESSAHAATAGVAPATAAAAATIVRSPRPPL